VTYFAPPEVRHSIDQPNPGYGFRGSIPLLPGSPPSPSSDDRASPLGFRDISDQKEDVMGERERTSGDTPVSMSPAPDDVEPRLQALEAKVQEIEAMLSLAMRLLSVENPVSVLLRRCGRPRRRSSPYTNCPTPWPVGPRRVACTRRPSARSSTTSKTVSHRARHSEFVCVLLDTPKLDRPA
jgi:hypothetical protein